MHFLWKKRARRPAKLRLKKHKMHLKKKWDIITCPLGHILQFIKSSALFQAKCLKAFSLQTKTFSTYFFGLKNEQLKAWNWAIKSLSVKSRRHKMQQLYLCTLSICPMSKDKRKKITFSCIIYPQKSKLPPFGSTNFFTALKGPKIGPRSKPYACPKLLAKSTHAVVLYLPREKPCHTIVWKTPLL